MRKFKIVSLLLIVFSSCNQKNVTEFYYIRCYEEYGNLKIDTVNVESENNQTKTTDDSLFFEKDIVLDDVVHKLRKYSNGHKAPTDGDYTFYELDSLGIVFSTQISWGSYKRLYTNNDSINRIIDFSLLNIIQMNEYDIKKNMEKVSYKTVEFNR